MRKIQIKGKPYRFHVGSTKTKLVGPSGTMIILNELISKGSITPGKVINYISSKLLAPAN